ncbi:MAG: DUF4071 domain-containing protein [Candidatus Aminicenantes bacterium]|nr:DUF4071 domain-containing protein [Candidatus Aminicenantes bacterium]
MSKLFCFILMPFGEKSDLSGKKIDFDYIYYELIHPAIVEAGLEPIRADEEKSGGMIHKAMFERLIMCDYAVTDMTTANANVFYELGVRHALRPNKTVLIFADRTRLPFDVGNLRALPYGLEDNGKLRNLQGDKENLIKNLQQVKKESFTDSPLFQLFDKLEPPPLTREKSDIFEAEIQYVQKIKDRIKAARKSGKEALKEIEQELGDFNDIESAVLIDLFLSYRAVGAWKEMVALVERLPGPLAARAMMQEQLGFALNRDGQREKAEEVLLQVIEKYGADSETYGLLGRVYKDRWETAREAGKRVSARALLEKAIAAYVSGFEADWRNAYPGINAMTLMYMKEPPDSRIDKLLPVVSFAVEQKIAQQKPEYWDYASLMELAVLADNREEAEKWLGSAMLEIRESFEPQTTVRNLRLIRAAGERRGEEVAWIKEIEQELLAG